MPDTNTDVAMERARDAYATLSKQEDNREWADKAMGHGANPSGPEPPDRLDDDELPPEKERGKH